MQELNRTTIIEFDYYDGATEGLIYSFQEHAPFYFKLIAWDNQQDQRLFVFLPIKSESFSRCVELIKDGNDLSSGYVRVKSAKNSEKNSHELEELINKINFYTKKEEEGLLGLGMDVSDVLQIVPIHKTDLSEVLNLRQHKPESLNKWMSLFKDVKTIRL